MAKRKGGESAPDASTIEQVQDARNCPEDMKHSEAIGEYIKENVDGKFILPPLTLNLSEEVIVHSIEYDTEPPDEERDAYPADERQDRHH